MSGRECAEVRQAIERVKGGESVPAAAEQLGLASSTLYRAIERRRKAEALQIAAKGDVSALSDSDVEI